jgi:hypothetical protein
MPTNPNPIEKPSNADEQKNKIEHSCKMNAFDQINSDGNDVYRDP